ncbi:MAG: hypothetical protein QNJ15_06895 [Erythrobacter sp.]|nr:hypothetical protein [Erythrobacter sp.]
MISTMVLVLALQAAEPLSEGEVVGSVEEAAIGVEETADASDGVEVAVATSDEASIAIPETPQPVAEVFPDIPRDTPVRLMVLNEVSTKDHEPGHKFKLRVDKPVLVEGREVIPVGAIAWGELLTAEKSGNVGKSGKLSAKLLYLDLDGREIPIEGETSSDGKSGKGETILGVIGLGVFGLFAKGNNAKLKAGEKITAFVAEDVMLEDAAS